MDSRRERYKPCCAKRGSGQFTQGIRRVSLDGNLGMFRVNVNYEDVPPVRGWMAAGVVGRNEKHAGARQSGNIYTAGEFRFCTGIEI
jgi:hypothetical protein